MAYSGPVIDTHHHIWLRKDVAWLADPPIPRMFGDYFGIRRDYPVEEFIQDVKPQGVTKSVHVTAMWGPGSRARRVQDGCNRSPTNTAFRTGSSAMPILRILNAENALKAQKQFPNLRGVRQMLYWDSETGAARRAASGFLQRSEFPPRVRAVGKTRSAFRIAGLCWAGGLRR